MNQDREAALAALAGQTEELLFVGGAAHGQVHTVGVDQHTCLVPVADSAPAVYAFEAGDPPIWDPLYRAVEYNRYTLRWARGTRDFMLEQDLLTSLHGWGSVLEQRVQDALFVHWMREGV